MSINFLRNRFEKACVCLALSLGFVTVSPQHVAAEQFSVGTKHSRVLVLDNPGKSVAVLPTGDWDVVAYNKFRNNQNTPYRVLGLMQTEGQRASQGMRIMWFPEPDFNGYVSYGLCKRKDVHHKKVYANYDGGDQDCYALIHYTPTFQGSKSKYNNAVGDLLSAKNIKWSHHFLTSDFRFADKFEAVDIRYHFDPVKYGFPDYEKTPWASSPWHPDNVRNDPDKKRFIEALKGWMEAAYPIIKRGWKNKLPANATLPEFRFGPSSDVLKQADRPVTTQPKTAAGQKLEETNTPQSKLERVKKLLERGLITEDEAANKRREILEGL